MNIEDKAKELVKKGFPVFPVFPIKWWNLEVYNDPKLAERYDSCGEWQVWAEECVDSAKILPKDIVADLGCGTGSATQKIIDKNPSLIYAIEPAKAMLDVFKKKIDAQKVNIIYGSIDELISSKLPSANKIISHGVVVVVQNKRVFFQKIYGYLPEKGLYIFTIEDWHNAFSGISLNEAEIQLAEFVHSKTGEKLPVSISGDYPCFYFEEIRALIQKTGGELLEYQIKEQTVPGEKYAKAYTGLYSENTLSAIQEFYASKKIVKLAQHLFVTTKKAK